MILSHPSHHTWYKILAQDPLTQFSKSNAKKIKATMESLSGSGITITETAVDQSFYGWFIPMYMEGIEKKEHPLAIDVVSKIAESPHTYHALCLMQNNTPVGAMVFTLREHALSLAYRMFNVSWPYAQLPASPALVMEHAICLHALTHGKKKLIHGKDRNPHGLNSSIGLAAFKLASGCKIRVPRQSAVNSLDTTMLESDALVMLTPRTHTRRITESCLITTKDNLHKYEQLLKYPHLLEVRVSYRD